MNIIRRLQKITRLEAMAAAFVLLSLFLVGCEAPQGGVSGSQTTVNNGGDREIFQKGDPITITFSDTPSPIAPLDERVKSDGTITLLYNKTFTAEGKNRSQLEQEIRKCYVPDYFRYLTVAVQPQQRFYYVGGEVKIPDRKVYAGPITVTQAIQSCGDFTDYAKRTRVQLIRADGKSYIVNCKKALQDPSLDLPVYPGDKINVPRSWL